MSINCCFILLKQQTRILYSSKSLLSVRGSREISTKMSESKKDYKLVEKNEMENFMERCMLSVGTNPEHAKSLAACLIAADYRGHFSHGLNRLGSYKLYSLTLNWKSRIFPQYIKICMLGT